MTMTLLSPGDTAYYPIYNNPHGKPMKVVDREVKVYKSGKMFVRYLYGDELMDNLVSDMHKNVESEYDNVLVIQGNEGSGKSQLAYQICKRFDPDFDLETSYIYDYEEFLKTITKADMDDRGRIFWMDEATNIASNRESMSQGNRKFVQLLEMMRSRGWTLVMCIPSVERLDVYIRDHRIRYLLTAMEKSWDCVYTESGRGYYELCFKYGDSYKTFHTVAYGTFGVMTPEERKVYDEVKKTSQKAKMDEIAGRAPKDTSIQRRIEDAIRVQYETKEKTVEELSKLYGLDVSTIRGYVHRSRMRLPVEERLDGRKMRGKKNDVE